MYFGLKGQLATFYILGGLLVLFIAYDLVRFFLIDKLDKYRQVYADDENYFARLGQMDRLRWLVLEGYMRKNFGVKMTDDMAFEAIRVSSKTNDNVSVDPPNFNILSNRNYLSKIGFTPVQFQDSAKLEETSKGVIVKLLGL